MFNKKRTLPADDSLEKEDNNDFIKLLKKRTKNGIEIPSYYGLRKNKQGELVWGHKAVDVLRRISSNAERAEPVISYFDENLNFTEDGDTINIFND